MTRPVLHTAAVAGDIVRAVRHVIGDAAPVPLHEPEFRGNEQEYASACITEGWVSSSGRFVDRFEEMLSERLGGGHAVCCVTGTAALHLALHALGVSEGDEVLVPTLTFVATANAVSYTGATPHFCEAETATLGIDAMKLDAHLRQIAVQDGERDGRPIFRNRETGRRIRAIVPMHVFGHASDLDGLLPVAAHYGLDVVEDAAEAIGSSYRGKPLGSFGRIGTLSFNGNKTITTGGGGAVYCDDADLAKQMRHLATTAKKPHRWAYEHDRIGFNFRLPNINAALGCAQLERLDDMLDRKQRLAAAYAQVFANVQGISFVSEPEGCHSNYWLNAIMLSPDTDLAMRDAILSDILDAGLMCRPVWDVMHRLPMYRNCPAMDISVADDLQARIICIPSSPALIEV